MKINTILLNLNDYNILRDFKTRVEEGLKESKIAVIETYSNGYGVSRTQKYYTENESILAFEKRNKELKERNKKLKLQNKELENKNKELEEELYKKNEFEKDLKIMTCRKFRKWRKLSKKC